MLSTTSTRHCQTSLSLSLSLSLFYFFFFFFEVLSKFCWVNLTTDWLVRCDAVSEADRWLASLFISRDRISGHHLLRGISTCAQWKKKLPPLRIKTTTKQQQNFSFYCQVGESADLWDAFDHGCKNRKYRRDVLSGISSGEVYAADMKLIVCSFYRRTKVTDVILREVAPASPITKKGHLIKEIKHRLWRERERESCL